MSREKCINKHLMELLSVAGEILFSCNFFFSVKLNIMMQILSGQRDKVKIHV